MGIQIFEIDRSFVLYKRIYMICCEFIDVRLMFEIDPLRVFSIGTVDIFRWWFGVLVSVCVSSVLSDVLGLVRFIASVLEDWCFYLGSLSAFIAVHAYVKGWMCSSNVFSNDSQW